jgi:hypothetical protein
MMGAWVEGCCERGNEHFSLNEIQDISRLAEKLLAPNDRISLWGCWGLVS